MVLDVVRHLGACAGRAFAAEALPLLVREHAYWTSGRKAVTVVGAGGRRHCLSRYYADWALPRPESWREDSEAAEGLAPEEARAALAAASQL